MDKFTAYDCTFDDDSEEWCLQVAQCDSGKFELVMDGLGSRSEILISRRDAQQLVMFLTEQINDPQ